MPCRPDNEKAEPEVPRSPPVHGQLFYNDGLGRAVMRGPPGGAHRRRFADPPQARGNGPPAVGEKKAGWGPRLCTQKGL
eukprot:15482917-Alexandrium_andersonii.AAC.1